MVLSVSIPSHTTTSIPRPHILYNVQVNRDGKLTTVERRYSEFLALNDAIGAKDITLPPKRILVTTFVPSAWVDDYLITERKTGLAKYLSNIVQIPDYENHPALVDFLKPSSDASRRFHLEDALPSTLSRKAALDIKDKVEAEASNLIAAAYYPDWSVWDVPPESIDFSKFDILFFGKCFSMMVDTSVLSPSKHLPSQISLQAWTGILIARTPYAAWLVLQAIVDVARRSSYRSVDGVEADGSLKLLVTIRICRSSPMPLSALSTLSTWLALISTGNILTQTVLATHTGLKTPPNLLKLFQRLRSALGADKIISAAVPHLPWIGSNGSPLTNISAWANVMTYINIMNYDVWGASANPGPNAPLNNGCGTSTQPQASAEAAFNQWTAAGAPASKLLLGFAPSSDMVLLQQDADGKNFLNGAHPRVRQDKQEDSAPTPAAADLRGWYGQQIPFKTLVAQGALVKDGDGNYRGGGVLQWHGMIAATRHSCTTYPNKQSLHTMTPGPLGDKAQFARDKNMAGCFTWSLDQDDGVALQNVIRGRLGK
ncbi:hypothetical protein VNI00_015644 [Paramarasmius palmivorus]|uniref:Chitinase n=1 Tax=Paramarasmius palmivorus TaxID=297713 RepID=A0AAW0BI97_9AGAR